MNKVFANGREISCKSVGGKSIAAFPDVCMTPPNVPVPYPNTAFAKDTANGSRTVFIHGKTVMQRDKSFFKTSTGNEPGTHPKKGVVTGVTKGKVYFTSWSMDVMVEGYNACRHQDMTTHNHASSPGNTGPWGYMDTSDKTKAACAADKAKIQKECKLSQEEIDKHKKKEEARNRQRKRKNKKPKNTTLTWKDKNCAGLMYVPSPKGIQKSITDMTAELKDTIDDLDGAIKDKLLEIAQDKATKMAGRTAVRHGVALLGGPFAAFTEALAAVVTVVDGAYSTVTGAIDAYNAYDEISKEITDANNIYNQYKAKEQKLKELVSLPSEENLSAAEKARKTELWQEVVGDAEDAMTAVADKNACIKARRCMLRPYNDANKSERDKMANTAGAGPCCPGQTAHHLIPGSYFQKSDGTEKVCDYDHDKAPCVCVEGTSNNGGSHGRIHKEQDQSAREILKKTKTWNYKEAKSAALKAHENAFPGKDCDSDCLEAQLDSYYSESCKKAPLRPVLSSNGAPLDKSKKTDNNTSNDGF